MACAEFINTFAACLARAGHSEARLGAVGLLTLFQELNVITVFHVAWYLHVIDHPISRYVLVIPGILLFALNLSYARRPVREDSPAPRIVVAYLVTTIIAFVVSVWLLLASNLERPLPWTDNPGEQAARLLIRTPVLAPYFFECSGESSGGGEACDSGTA